MPPKFLSHLRAILSIREGLLDQFYYPALDDTTAWDADQTVSKWSGRDLGTDGRNTAAPDSLLIMVDQLWCWVLDERQLHMSSNSWISSKHTDGSRTRRYKEAIMLNPVSKVMEAKI
jgi:hypothetical protein